MARERRPERGGDPRSRWSGSVAADVIEAMPEAVVVCDGDGRIVAANEALHRLLGYDDHELVGRRLEKLVPRDLRDLHRAHRDAFVREAGPGGHRAGRRFQARHRDGHLIDVDIAIANLRADAGPLSLALVRDLTDPVAAGRQLAHLAELYALAANALSAVLHADDEEGLHAAVCDVAIDHGTVSLAWVGAVHEGWVVPLTISGPLAASVDGLEARLGDDEPAAMAVTLRSAVVVPDLRLEPAFRIDPGAPGRLAGSLCVLPLVTGDRVSGVLGLVSPLISGFPDDAVTVLEWLAAEVSVRLDAFDVQAAADAAARAALEAIARAAAAERATAVEAAVATAVAMERESLAARARSEADAREQALLDAHEQALADAVETARADERAAAERQARKQAEQRERVAAEERERALAEAVEAARAEERARHELEAAAAAALAEVAEQMATDETTGPTSDPERAARLDAHAHRQDVAVQLALLALATADPVDVADAVVGALGRTLAVDSAVLVETGPDNDSVVRAAWFGAQPSTGEYQTDRHADLHDMVIVRGGPLVVDDLGTDPRFAGLGHDDDHAGGVAVLVGGPPGFHGSLSVLSVESRHFDDDEVAFLERMADVMAAAFERARDQSPPRPELLVATVTDPLTGLPNRALVRDRLDQLLGRVADTDPLVGVLVVHLEDLDSVTERHGTEVAEGLVAGAADRLRGAMDTDDVVGRTQTDELTVVHATDGTIDDFTDLTDRVRVALAPPFLVGGLSVRVTTGIGVSIRPAGDTSADQLLSEAEAAASRASGLGRGRTELYDHDLRRQARHRIDQATALRRAIDDDELIVVWQAAFPLQPAEDGQPEEVWAEALVRWRNPERGLVSPGNFIHLAEETGLIVPVGDLVLRKACRQLAAWRSAPGLHPSRISVNLSPREIANDDLAGSVAAALADAEVEPSAVMFEVTESALTAGPDDAIRRLNELRDLGVGLAMDDFGTGYSSLGYLRRMPVSVLKIDQSFIRGLTTHRADWAIVHGIVEMAHGIGLTVVAEGIETAEQLDHLVALGCDRGQGYLWSSPVPAEALDEVLADWTGPAPR